MIVRKKKEGTLVKRNSVKIVCNPFERKISYFYKNEIGEWLLMSSSSPLSRQQYTTTDMKKSCKIIIEKINEVYNRKNKGVDILFEGTSDNYELLSSVINTDFANYDIKCIINTTEIAVVGKKNVGKTFLIEGIAKEYGNKLNRSNNNQYKEYKDWYNHVEWLEVNGIDVGNENIDETYRVISNLVKYGLSKVIYCISGETGRIEEMERKLLIQLKQNFPSIDILIAITKSYKNNDDIKIMVDEIKKYIGNDKVFPVLAQEYEFNTSIGEENSIIKPYGLEDLVTYLFEEKKLYHKKLKKSANFQKSEIKQSKYNTIEENSINILNSNKSVHDVNKKEKILSQNEETLKLQGIIVVGKKGTGKTALIEGAGEFIHDAYVYKKCVNYEMYENNFLRWYEISGIEFGRGGVEEVFYSVVNLSEHDTNITHMMYCVSGETGKVEQIEKNFIMEIKKRLPNIKVIVVLTKCYKDENIEIINQLEKIVGKGNVIETLAKKYNTGIRDYKTKEKIFVKEYGLNIVYDKIKGK